MVKSLKYKYSKLTPEQKELIDRILSKKVGTATGSAVFYPQYSPVDQDYIMSLSVMVEVFPDLEDEKEKEINCAMSLYPEASMVANVKIIREGFLDRDLDLIVCDSPGKYSWEMATYEFEEAISGCASLRHACQTKAVRVAVFQGMREYYREGR